LNLKQGSDGEWRPATAGDKFCIPANEQNNNNNQQVNPNQFQVGCKVPDHTGPLGEGWEVNHQWDSSITNGILLLMILESSQPISKMVKSILLTLKDWVLSFLDFNTRLFRQ